MSKKKKNRIDITDEDLVQVEWYNEAHNVSESTLQKFIDHVMHDYNHTYESYIHAITACALATTFAYGVAMDPIQESVVSILYPRHLYYGNSLTGISIRNWDDMLYPQYEGKFDKIISKRMWDAIQKAAKENLVNHPDAAPEVVDHWTSICSGVVPFGYKIIDPDETDEDKE